VSAGSRATAHDQASVLEIEQEEPSDLRGLACCFRQFQTPALAPLAIQVGPTISAGYEGHSNRHPVPSLVLYLTFPVASLVAALLPATDPATHERFGSRNLEDQIRTDCENW
jgi:hypothetical protein